MNMISRWLLPITTRDTHCVRRQFVTFAHSIFPDIEHRIISLLSYLPHHIFILSKSCILFVSFPPLVCQAFINLLSCIYRKNTYFHYITCRPHMNLFPPTDTLFALVSAFPFLPCITVSPKMSKFVSVLQPRGRFASRHGPSARIITHHPALFRGTVNPPWEKRELAHSAGFWSQPITSKRTITYRSRDLSDNSSLFKPAERPREWHSVELVYISSSRSHLGPAMDVPRVSKDVKGKW